MKRTVEMAGLSLALILFFLSAVSVKAVLPGQFVAQKKLWQKKRPSPPPKVEPTATPAPISESAIPLPQIIPRAEEAVQKLHAVNERLAIDSTLTSIDQTFKSQEAVIREKQIQLNELIAITPTRSELQDVEQEWHAYKELYDSTLKKLTGRAKAVEEDVKFLDKQQAEWEAVLKQTLDPAAIDPVIERIRNVLSETGDTRKRATEILRYLLVLQDQVSRQDKLVQDAMMKISHERDRLERDLLDPDSPPLWEAAAITASAQSINHMIRLSFNRNLARTREFIKARRYTGLGILSLFLAALAICFTIRHQIPGWMKRHPDFISPIYPFQRPISLAILIVLMVLLPMMVSTPAQIRTMMVLLSLVPVMRLLAPLIRPGFRPLLYVLIVFGVTSWLWESAVASSELKRWGLVVLSIAVIAIVLWLTRRARREIGPADRKARLIINAIYLSMALILISLMANVFGYVGLSRVLRSGTVFSIYSAVLLYAAYIVIEIFIYLLSRTRRHRSQSTAGLRGEIIVGWTLRLMSLGAFFIWAYITLNCFTIREKVLNGVSVALTTPIKLRAASFTFGDVFTFILVIAAGFSLAGIIRIVLRESILGRLNLKLGIPYAVSTVTYYLLLLSVFLLALSAAGVELSKFTILTGAFGVGAGFGMQNIINNFISGLILLFERPIRIGDFLEIDRTAGEVTRMGLRSSSIRTPQGAEVIVPNSSLISNQVVNWTLTEEKRRTELLVKVAYGEDPEKVARILVETAVSHPDVLPEPEPTVFFLGFGDTTSLGFELSFWVPKLEMHKRVNSEVAMKIAHAFREAGIEFPAPKRAPVAGTDASVKEQLAAGGSKL
jgi:potassium-dependent mechanosensitive channel